MLTFSDIKNDAPKCLDYLDSILFVDSTITMADEDYIKSSIENKLVQRILLTEGLVSLDQDPDSLKRAMLRSSLNQKDIDLMLTASLKIAQVKLTVSSEEEQLREASEEKSEKLIKSKQETLGSLSSLINIVESCDGTSRIVYHGKNEDNPFVLSEYLQIQRPLKFDIDKIQLDKLNQVQLNTLLMSSLRCDSNSQLDFFIPLAGLPEEVQVFLTETLPALCQAGAEYCKNNSTKYAKSFIIQEDPFKTLFNSL